MISREGLFLCAGLRAAQLHRETLDGPGRLNLEVQHFVSAESIENEFDERLEHAAGIISETGVRCLLHAPFRQVNFFSNNASRRSRSMTALRRSFDAAAALGAQFVIVHSLYVPRRRNTAYGEHWRENARPFFRAVATEAAARGLKIAVENMLEPSPEGLLWLLGEMNGAGARVCFDAAHAALAGGAPAGAWVSGLGEALVHLHLSDNHGIHDDHLPLGVGGVTLPEALEAAADLPQEVTLGIECRMWPEKNLSVSLEYLKAFLG